MKISIKQVVKYDGHSVSSNGSVNLTFKAGYDELSNSVKLLQLLNNDVKIRAKVGANKPMLLGMFRVKNVIIDGDGESKLKFNGLSDYIELDNLNVLPLSADDNERFNVMFEAEVETEEEEGDDE